MAPKNASKKQAEQAAAAEDVESEQETLDPRAISKDMEKNVKPTGEGREPKGWHSYHGRISHRFTFYFYPEEIILVLILTSYLF